MLPKKLRPLWMLTLLITAIALAACGGADVEPEEEEVEEEAPEDTEEVEEEVQPTISGDILLDPANADDAASETINELLYDTLVESTATGLQPGIASSWIVSDDELDWIISLRGNAVFHDGSPIDADAVVANFNRWFDPSDPLHGNADYLAWEEAFGGFLGEDDSDGVDLSTFDGVEKVDETTVVLHLTRPEPDMLELISDTAFSIVNPAAIEADVNGYGLQGSDISGSGAYQLEAWNNDELVLAEFASYYATVPEAPDTYTLE